MSKLAIMPILPCTEKTIKYAADIIDNDGIIMIPTDTVYGIACNAKSNIAIEAIYNIKKRNKTKPFQVLISEQIKITTTTLASRIISELTPGNVTIVGPNIIEGLPDILYSKSANEKTKYLGIRRPMHAWCTMLLNYIDVPLATTSANESTSIASYSPYNMPIDIVKQIDIIFYDQQCKNIRPSAIVQCADNNNINILRHDAILDKNIIEYIASIRNEMKY